ncbi:MAG TPA: amidohydrolase family protein [Bryobacteraceae bacterium]|nr:amidohydrolase family protein [Bryobacteraceae bacterium]
METSWGDLPVWDAHVHFFSRRFFESLAAQTGRDLAGIAAELGWELPRADATDLGARWAAELDARGVAGAALIASIPGDESSVVEAASAFRERFLAYAMVNPLAGQAPATGGLDALCFFPAMHGYFIHDARVKPMLEAAAATGAMVFVHCGALTVGVRKKLGLPSPFDMRYSNPIELHPVALRYPQLRFVIPHFGAGYFREALLVADLCPNVYLDTSSSNSWMRYEGLDLKTVFRRSLDVIGPTRLLFGTDSSYFPRGWNADIFTRQARALAELGVSGADAGWILGGNLRRLRSITKSASAAGLTPWNKPDGN